MPRLEKRTFIIVAAAASMLVATYVAATWQPPSRLRGMDAPDALRELALDPLSTGSQVKALLEAEESFYAWRWRMWANDDNWVLRTSLPQLKSGDTVGYHGGPLRKGLTLSTTDTTANCILESKVRPLFDAIGDKGFVPLQLSHSRIAETAMRRVVQRDGQRRVLTLWFSQGCLYTLNVEITAAA